jgi:Spy/CpxP family protein refolding chaperone
MKKPLIILILSFVSLISFAQIERTPVKRSDSAAGNQQAMTRADRLGKKDMMKDLDLSKEQRSKLKDIRQSGKTKKEAIESNDKLSEDEKKKQLREFQKEQAQAV